MATIILRLSVGDIGEDEAVLSMTGAVSRWAESRAKGGALAGTAEASATQHSHQIIIGLAAGYHAHICSKAEVVFKEINTF